MRCPFPDCRKDYNDDHWPKAMEGWINPSGVGDSIKERQSLHRLFVITRRCKFCLQFFHDVYVGHENFEDHTKRFTELEPTIIPLVTYPVSKTQFEAKNIPKKIIDAFNEAERCRAVGSLTGVGGCLRKTVYALCDEIGVQGRDYREKIANLPVKDIYQELLKQIKWLGDNATKPDGESYTMEMADLALEMLPLLIDDLYLKDERVEKAAKLLAKGRSISGKDSNGNKPL